MAESQTWIEAARVLEHYYYAMLYDEDVTKRTKIADKLHEEFIYRSTKVAKV